MVNGGISLYIGSLVFKDIWGNVLLIYKNNYVFVIVVIIYWGCMVIDDVLNILLLNEINLSIICY